jgi:hypothetical protein
MVYSSVPTQSDLVELAEHVPYDTDSAEVQERHVVVNSAEGGDNARTQEVPTGRPSWTSVPVKIGSERSEGNRRRPMTEEFINRIRH